MLASKVVPQLCKTIARRNFSNSSGSVIAGPPSVRVSFAEKAGLGSIMILSFLIVPAWVMVHMEEYKGHK